MGNNGKQYLLAIQHVLLGNISNIYNMGSNIYTIDKKDQSYGDFYTIIIISHLSKITLWYTKPSQRSIIRISNVGHHGNLRIHYITITNGKWYHKVGI